MSRPVPGNVLRYSIQISPKRLASIASDKPSSHYSNEWPKSLHPTPYQVLNISSAKFDRQKLRAQYYKLAKVYHPDISSSKHIKDHRGSVLTDSHKNERFKLLTEAYALLKDPRKKSAYDRHKIGWGSASRHLNDDAFSNQRKTHATQSYYSTHEYWNAANWEDYQNLHKNHSTTTGTEVNQDKMKVLAVIICFIIGTATLQGWFIFDNVEKAVLEHKRKHDDCEADLGMAYANYGLEGTKLARIKRFLWFRTFSLYTQKEKLDESSKENESLIREVIGEVD
jgi:hypothetical protein